MKVTPSGAERKKITNELENEKVLNSENSIMPKSIVGIAKSTSEVEAAVDDLQNDALVDTRRHLRVDAGFRRYARSSELSKQQSLLRVQPLGQ